MFESPITYLFQTLNQSHQYNTRATNNEQLEFPSTQITHCGTYSFRKKAAEGWNEI